jgi:hypothetical protein
MVFFTYDHDEKKPMDVKLDDLPLYGIERAAGVHTTLPRAGATAHFLTLDDDGNPMGSGWLHDDPECENQTAALRYAESTWGATVIKVARAGDWKQEIG